MRTEPLRSHALVGRAAELDALLDRAGRSRGLVLAGDAGVGKTRLLTELQERLRAEGWRVLLGHCLDFGDTAIPYLPFSEALAELAASDPAGHAALLDRHPALSRLTHRAPAPDAEGVGRSEVFEAVSAALGELSVDAPVVVVVEDVHWADPSSRDLLTFLLRRAVPGSVLVVVSYRTDDLHRRHPLRPVAGEWVRIPGVTRLVLEPLAPAAVRSLIGELTASQPGPLTGAGDEPEVRQILERAEGNPFYVEELVGAYLAGERTLPDDLAALLLVRLDRLDDAARTVVRAAAVGGQRVSHDLLATVVPVRGPELEQAIRATVDAQVLVRDGEDHYAFRHALLGEAAYDDLLPGERTRLHTAYADALRERRDAAGSAALARHALAAHDLPTALAASVLAGERALRVGGPDEAVKHLQRALEIHPRVPADPTDPAAPEAPEGPERPDLTALVVLTAEALSASGRPESAYAVVRDHLDRLPGDATPRQRARLLLAMADTALETDLDADVVAWCDEALALVGPEPSELRARLLQARADHSAVGALAQANADASEALRVADALGLERLVTSISVTLTSLAEEAGATEELRADYVEMIERARRDHDLPTLLRAERSLGEWHYERGELAAAVEVYRRGADEAARAGQPWAPLGVACRHFAAVIAFMRGDWDEALAIADVAGQDPPPLARALLTSARLVVAAGRGEESALEALPPLRAVWHQDVMVAITAGGAAIDLLGKHDGPDAAVTTYDDVTALVGRLWWPHFGAKVRLAAVALGALADGSLRLPSAEHEGALRTGARLAAEAEEAVTRREAHDRAFSIEGQAWHARVRAEHLRLRWLLGDAEHPAGLEELVAAWEATAGLFARLGHDYERARCLARLGAVLRAAGRSEDGAAAIGRARELAAPMGAWLGVGATPTRAVEAGELTPREREILALVARGLTNGQVGKQLFIATKTVSVHVSHVLAKLGASSRTEAAALARERGLLDP